MNATFLLPFYPIPLSFSNHDFSLVKLNEAKSKFRWNEDWSVFGNLSNRFDERFHITFGGTVCVIHIAQLKNSCRFIRFHI